LTLFYEIENIPQSEVSSGGKSDRTKAGEMQSKKQIKSTEKHEPKLLQFSIGDFVMSVSSEVDEENWRTISSGIQKPSASNELYVHKPVEDPFVNRMNNPQDDTNNLGDMEMVTSFSRSNKHHTRSGEYRSRSPDLPQGSASSNGNTRRNNQASRRK